MPPREQRHVRQNRLQKVLRSMSVKPIAKGSSQHVRQVLRKMIFRSCPFGSLYNGSSRLDRLQYASQHVRLVRCKGFLEDVLRFALRALWELFFVSRSGFFGRGVFAASPSDAGKWVFGVV